MSHKLELKNLGPIGECSIELKTFNIFTGPQSSGKSTIAKAIFYFRSLKQDILRIMMQGGPAGVTGEKEVKWLSVMQQNMREKFLQIFGTSWSMPDDMEMRYTFSREEIFIHVCLKEDYYQGRNYIYIEFSPKLRSYFDDLDTSVFTDVTEGQMEIERKRITKLLDDPCEVLFIPAGRSMITLLSTQLNYIFTSLEGSQLRNIDYVTKRFTETILKLKPMFSRGMQGYIEEIQDVPELYRKYAENRPAINLLMEYVKKILQGNYRYVDGEERLYLDNRKYVKINFSSSGQQEVVWVLNLLFYYLVEDKRVFLILEEPESHLYPDAQRLMGEILGMFLNEGKNQVLVTTHSPYLLGTFNYMLQAGQCSKPAGEVIKKKLRKRFWLKSGDTGAYFVHDSYVEDALSREEGLVLVKNELIDGASIEINEMSDFILEQDFEVQEGMDD